MFRESSTQLNHSAMVGYDFGTRGGNRLFLRIDGPTISERRADMDVSGLGRAHGAGPVRPTNVSAPTPPNSVSPKSAPITAPTDEVQISEAARMMDRLSETSEARAERIAQIKEAIANGTYDTDEKLEAAFERLFEVHGFGFDDE